MKTLEDWLASSSSSSSLASSLTSSPRVPTITNVEKLEENVASAVRTANTEEHQNSKFTETQEREHKKLLATSPMSINTDSKKSSYEEQGCETEQESNSNNIINNKSATLHAEEERNVISQKTNVENKFNASSGAREDDETKYERIEVMVVDRGTQTVTTTSTQTDEAYFVPCCPHCASASLSARFGSMRPFQQQQLQLPLTRVTTTAAINAGEVKLHNRLHQAVNYVQAEYPTGIDGRPYRQLFSRFAQEQHREASELLQELEIIQNSVDMLISRYNLPPPPLLPQEQEQQQQFF